MTEFATMFLNNLSVVDHCIIDNDGYTIGGSFNPSFLVSGKIDPVEKVVVDFSTVKKQMKNCIDGKSLGFDHKCWIVEHYSNCKIYLYDATGAECTNFESLDTQAISDEQIVAVVTPYAIITAPKNAFKFIPNPEKLPYSIESAARWMEKDLHKEFPELAFVCNNNVEAHTYLDQNEYPIAYFAYAHGLRDSTSYGCQNIAHGHLSFIQTDSKTAQIAISEIAIELDCTMFINAQNVVSDNLADLVDMSYQSHSRGTFSAIWKSGNRQKPVILPTETTIEYLVKYVADTYGDKLRAAGATKLFVSEGLSKGAWIDLTNEVLK